MRVPYFWLKDYIETDLPAKEVARMLTMAGHALDKPMENEVMDFEDRGNRADVMGIVGLARDLAAILRTVLNTGTVPKIRTVPYKADNRAFRPKISVETEEVIRWTAVAFKNIKIQPSVPFVAERLSAYGLSLVNNIVDLTNFVMVELGMPLHAFDLDQVRQIILRPAKKGESLVTFEGTKLDLDEDDLVAADDKNPLTLTTAVGGRASGVSESTTNILVEAGLYHQPTARHSAIRHNVRNETSSRLGKYLHPEYCQLAIERFIFLMKELYGLEPQPAAFDYYPENYQKEYSEKTVELSQSRLNLIAGEEIPLPEAMSLLSRLGFESQGSGVSCRVSVPYFRTDATMEDDLIEEVLRIRGYDKVPSYLPARPSPDRLSFPLRDTEEEFRDAAVKLGFNEVISQPIIDIKDSLNVGLTDQTWKEKMVYLENSWNQELNIMRPEMISGQLRYFLAYQKRGIKEIKIFEIGKTYAQDPSAAGYSKFKETRKAVLTISENYLALKSRVETLLGELGIANFEFKKLELLFKRSRGASITVNGEEIGKMGEIKNSVLAKYGLKEPVCHAAFYTEKLLKYAQTESPGRIAIDIINYISEDFTFRLRADQEVGAYLNRLKARLDPTTQITFKGVFQDEKMKKGNKKAVTINIKYNPLSYRQELATVKEVLSKML